MNGGGEGCWKRMKDDRINDERAEIGIVVSTVFDSYSHIRSEPTSPQIDEGRSGSPSSCPSSAQLDRHHPSMVRRFVSPF